MTPLASVAILEKLALLKIARCSAPALRSASSASLCPVNSTHLRKRQRGNPLCRLSWSCCHLCSLKRALATIVPRHRQIEDRLGVRREIWRRRFLTFARALPVKRLTRCQFPCYNDRRV